ncbi:MAG: TolC family protein [Sulfurospirillum sp.]|nr:TolC family protein [Sulfurospirillum sp.]
MFAKSIFALGFLYVSSFAISFEALTQKALAQNDAIASLQKESLVAGQDILLAQKWSNPVLSIGANDILFDDIGARDLEPMQAVFVAISQLIPLGKKLEYQTQIASIVQKIAQTKLEDAKLKLVSSIYANGYDLLIAQKKFALLEGFEQNLQELQTVLLALYENSNANQVASLQVQLLRSNLQIQKENIRSKIATLQLNLEQLSYEKNIALEADLSLEKAFLVPQNLSTHPFIQSIEFAIKKYNTLAQLEEEKKHSDLRVNFGYFSRDAKYKDYANLSFSMPLAIYGTEDVLRVKAKYQSSQALDVLHKTKQVFKTNFEMLQVSMATAFANYQNLLTSMVPQRNFIQESLALHNALGHNSVVDLIKNFNEIITLQLLGVDEMQKYFNAYAQSIYYTGIPQ